VFSGLTQEQITDMPDYEHDEERFRELEAEGTVQLQTGPATTSN
jgi:hypothetical protein